MKFEDWRLVNQFDSEFNFHEFKKARHDLKETQEKLDQLCKWEILVSSSIKAKINRGLVFVNGKLLRDKLIGSVRTALKDTRDYLSDLTEAESQEILDGLRVTRRNLAKGMTNLTEYVDYAKALNEAKEKLEQLSDEKSVFEEKSFILRKSSKSKDNKYNRHNRNKRKDTPDQIWDNYCRTQNLKESHFCKRGIRCCCTVRDATCIG